MFSLCSITPGEMQQSLLGYVIRYKALESTLYSFDTYYQIYSFV